MGYAVAEAFAAEGAVVGLVNVDAEKLNAAKDNLIATGYNAIAAVTDVFILRRTSCGCGPGR